MRVLFISQCTKKATHETRRILDQFAERKGVCAWETNITLQGLETVKRLLKSTARKNTSVACHKIRGKLTSQLLWIVGNSSLFNERGNVPTNLTRKDVLRANDENEWQTIKSIGILSSLAGLFHDFGKANDLFQAKLQKIKGVKSYEPLRHEWISLLLFKALIHEKTDKEWLHELTRIGAEKEISILENLPKSIKDLKKNPLANLPPVAKTVGWLILCHHRLPVPKTFSELPLEHIDTWIEKRKFLSAEWNSYACNENWSDEAWEKVRNFEKGLPITSQTWRKSASSKASEALKYFDLINKNWFEDLYSLHLMRTVLMLSDHAYSSEHSSGNFQDKSYSVYANTKEGRLDQKLDQHNIQVSRYAYYFSKILPELRNSLSSLSPRLSQFRKRSQNRFFSWQDKAYDVAYALRDESEYKGFFGVNLASTGKGKTLANARIMYALSNNKTGCRFSIALGLRVLTLQTGEALRKKLNLSNDEIGVLIGSKSFQQLSGIHTEGSESSQDPLDGHYVDYEGISSINVFDKWIKRDSKINKLISSPILVSTIDHLIPASEGIKGGKQIAPILRLLTSDLVVDEPDDFDAKDLHALSRLVNLAGVFGARVLLSSATLTPSIIEALFDAYKEGRKIFNKSRGIEADTICTAFFDEYRSESAGIIDIESYKEFRSQFVESRISNLKKEPVIRKGEIIPVNVNRENPASEIAESVENHIYNLHNDHFQRVQDKKVSFGLLRFANINPMIAASQQILSKIPKENYCIHYCIYHSRHPMIIRSKIEKELDTAFLRHNPDAIFLLDSVKRSLEKSCVENHLFIVFATSIAEVGRDHDYDWSIVEPSSMRSIIQLAGRVQRHRKKTCEKANIKILQRNYKGIKSDTTCFHRPGFETEKFNLQSKDLKNILDPDQYEIITSIPRLTVSETCDHTSNLVDLEHARLNDELMGEQGANLWWKHKAHLFGILQKITPFRKTSIDRTFFTYIKDEKNFEFSEWDDNSRLKRDRLFERHSFAPPKNVFPWIETDLHQEISAIAEKTNMSLQQASITFTSFNIFEDESIKPWIYDPIFGIYKEY